MTLSEDFYGKLINIAGRQRMLSQRIGFLFLTLNGQIESRQSVPGDLWDMLEKALSDFQKGYALLCDGDAEAGLPRLESERITAVLEARAERSGRAVIERFLCEAECHMRDLGNNKVPERATFDAFSDLVLVDVLQVLQAIVEALEADFSDEMQRRRELRRAEATRVMGALQEIQKASKFSRMIALNAKISADRAGPYGKEFGALTEELKKIATSISDSSEDILKHMQQI